VATDVLGVSGRAMLEALVAGTHDPEVLAALAKGRLRAKLPALREALAGRFRTDHHGLLVAQILAHVECMIAELGGRHVGVPYRCASGLVGRPLAGQQPHRRQTPLGQAHQGQPLAG
jgi:hypothetical protein